MDPEPANSSPRARPDSSDDVIAAAAANNNPLPSKLRLMCSYGGHIIPRPHDKSLCYVGGDTRIVVADRRSSLADLHSRLSQTLLNGRHFTLKYQLPAEDLDSLISLATDEDLENMIEEYDRTAAAAASPLKASSPSSRIRLFLFPTKPETAASMGSLLDDAKSETWFVDALNGAGLLPRGLSESAAIDTLLELNRDPSSADLEAQKDEILSSSSLGNIDKHLAGKSGGQLELVLDSPPVMETSSSFGSSSSTPSMANLPPIKVGGGEGYVMMVGLDEQMSHVNIGGGTSNLRGGGGENAGRAVGEEERSEKPEGVRKPPLPSPLQPVQRKVVDIHNLASPDSKHAGPHNLPSPDSVASDCSIASAGSLSKHTVYQDPTNRDNTTRTNPTPLLDPNKTIITNIQEPNPQPPLQHHQPFNHPPPPGHHGYIHHQSYYHPMYVQTQTPQQPNMNQHPNDQPYPMYLFPPLPQTPPLTPPLNNNMASSYTKEAAGGPVTFVQVPTNQYQQQYVPANYGYEYSHHLMQDQMYYGRQAAAASAAPPSQYQTMSPATAVMLSQASSQMTTPDHGNQQS